MSGTTSTAPATRQSVMPTRTPSGGKFEQAETEFTKLRSKNPSRDEVTLELARLHQASGKTDQAFKWLRSFRQASRQRGGVGDPGQLQRGEPSLLGRASLPAGGAGAAGAA